MHEAVAAIAACGVSPLVRVAANEGWMVKRMIDQSDGSVMHELIATGALDSGGKPE